MFEINNFATFKIKKMEWYIPITVLPGICLLLLSTVTLTVSLNDEIKGMLNQEDCNTFILNKKLNQLKKLTISKTTIYFSIAMFVFAGLLAGISNQGIPINNYITNTFIILGVLALLVSLVYLIIYSLNAVKIRQQQFQSFTDSAKKK